MSTPVDFDVMRRLGVMRRDLIPLITDIRPPYGREYWLTDDMMPKNKNGELKPALSVSVVGQVFFGHSGDWLRRMHKLGDVFIDGKLFEPKRTKVGDRYYTLADVERLAEALLQSGKIDGMQFIAAIHLVRWVAFQYGILTGADMVVGMPFNDRSAEGEREMSPDEIGK
jgi:hypothetical protein